MNDLLELKNISQNISVLYVEDDEIIREQTTKLLLRIFKDIDIAKDGLEGLSFHMKSEYDLVISDIVMAKMNGIEMIEVMKNTHPEQNIILLSAYTNQKFLTDAIDIGVDSFVFKPMDTNKFYDAIRKVVKRINLKKENLEYKKGLEDLVAKKTVDLNNKNIELQNMISELKKINKIKEEMKLAQRVQEDFLPKGDLSNERMDISTFFQSATYVGGDYYDLFDSNDEFSNIIIADVSGHGLAPAITMNTFRGICRAILGLSIDFERQIFLINNLLCQESKNSDFFITAVFIRYYKKENYIEYISTGHNDFLHYSKEQNSINNLKSTAIPLAIFKDTTYEIKTIAIEKGDSLLLYTDGIVEAKNNNNEMFSLDKLLSIFEYSIQLDSKKTLNNIVSSLNNFTQDCPIEDDTTILVIKLIK